MKHSQTWRRWRQRLVLDCPPPRRCHLANEHSVSHALRTLGREQYFVYNRNPSWREDRHGTGGSTAFPGGEEFQERAFLEILIRRL